MHGFLRLNKEKENIRIFMVATFILFSEKFLLMIMYTKYCVFVCSVMPNSLLSYGLLPARLLCP